MLRKTGKPNPQLTTHNLQPLNHKKNEPDHQHHPHDPPRRLPNE